MDSADLAAAWSAATWVALTNYINGMDPKATLVTSAAVLVAIVLIASVFRD